MLQPYFLKADHGQLFIQAFTPEKKAVEAVIFIPPFAEEMNKSRRMIALLGYGLASKGMLMVVPDLFGTGDSEGGFSQARWSIWMENLEQLRKKLISEGITRIHLVGLRMGCLLIDSFLSVPRDAVEKIIFWKPVLSGKQMVNQFLRLRVANSMMDGRKETTQVLRSLLSTEGILEVAGYSLNKALISALDEKTLGLDMLEHCSKAYWFDISSMENQPLGVAVAKFLDGAEQRGYIISQQTIMGENFWVNQEITEVPKLISVTCNALFQE